LELLPRFEVLLALCLFSFDSAADHFSFQPTTPSTGTASTADTADTADTAIILCPRRRSFSRFACSLFFLVADLDRGGLSRGCSCFLLRVASPFRGTSRALFILF
jgi:hypothetical protein